MSVDVEGAVGLKEAVYKYDEWLEEQAQYYRDVLRSENLNDRDHDYMFGSYEAYMCAIHMFTCVTKWVD